MTQATDGTMRVSTQVALDFGTYGECAAGWAPGMQGDGPRDLSSGHLDAANEVARAAGLNLRFSVGEDIDLLGVSDEADLRPALWQAVFDVPPLSHVRLQLLLTENLPGLDAEGAWKVGHTGAQLLGRRGLKRRLLGDTIGDELFRELVNAYKDLYRQAVNSLSSAGGGGDRRVPHVVFITFPTRLPSAQRNRLINELRKDPEFATVKPGFDEATAVANFDLMVRLGPRQHLGAAALQARHAGSAGIVDRVLVVDVGAGTTDVALVDLWMLDRTPEVAHDAPGRNWRIEPTVVSSGGALDFGADQLTLEVFKLLKRRLSEVGPAIHTDFATAGLTPPEAAGRRATFVRLWEEAERLKVTLLTSQDARRSQLGPLPDVTLDWERDLRPLAENFARRVATLAVGISKAGLDTLRERGGRVDGPERIDRVVLAGQTFRSGFIADRVTSEVRALLRAEREHASFEIALYPDYLKKAAALGAAYGGATDGLTVNPENLEVIAGYRAGHHRFSISPRSLWANLTAAFELVASLVDDTSQSKKIFVRGQPYDIDSDSADGPRRARSRPVEVFETMQVMRVDAARLRSVEGHGEQRESDQRIEWGWFALNGWRDLLEREPERTRDILVTFEIDEQQTIVAYVHHGSVVPLGLAPGTVLREEKHKREEPPLVGGGRVLSPVYLNAVTPQGVTGAPVIPAGTPLPAAFSVEHVLGDVIQIGVPSVVPDRFRIFIAPKGTRWISLGHDGLLRAHTGRPMVEQVRDYDQSERMTEELVRQDPTQPWALRLTMHETNHYLQQADPFSGIH